MPANPRSTSKKYVVIVDDHHAGLEEMEAALEREFRVLLPSDVFIADSVLDRETVDLIILDVLLGPESGLDFLDRLRKKSGVPVLLISGYGTKEMVIAGMRSRANDYMDKPFTGTQLLEKTRSLIARDRVRTTSQTASAALSNSTTHETGQW